jgi:uncharacterized protein
VGIGSISGFLSGLAQIGGPPVVLYWLGGQNDREVIRANLILFFACTTVFTGISYVVVGLFTREALLLSILVIPVYAVALWLGHRMFGMASEKTFRNVCYGLIALAILVSLPVFDRLRD